LRDSSLVAVRHVHITGVHGADALQIRQALDAAAGRMTTMDFDTGALRSAVSSFAIVGSVHVATSFPHTVSISVVERPPVAALLSAGERTAVAADGTVLGPDLLSSSLPIVDGSVVPSSGGRLREGQALSAVTVLGAAPATLARFVVRAFTGPEGLTLAMRNGLLVYFGNSLRPHAKWLSLARVLVSPSAAGATYIDVRLPERPAAGFSSTSSSIASSAASSSSPTRLEGSEPTATALAASLSKAAGGSAATAAGSAMGSSATAEEKEGTSHSETTSGSAASAGTGESESSSGSSEAATPSGGESSSATAGGAGTSTRGTSGEATTSATGGSPSAPVPGG
jgi:cell division protein FtsQ